MNSPEGLIKDCPASSCCGSLRNVLCPLCLNFSVCRPRGLHGGARAGTHSGCSPESGSLLLAWDPTLGLLRVTPISAQKWGGKLVSIPPAGSGV